MQGTSSEFGSVIGIAVIGSLAAYLYQRHFRVPDDIFATLAHAARVSLGEAIALSQGLAPHCI